MLGGGGGGITVTVTRGYGEGERKEVGDTKQVKKPTKREEWMRTKKDEGRVLEFRRYRKCGTSVSMWQIPKTIGTSLRRVVPI